MAKQIKALLAAMLLAACATGPQTARTDGATQQAAIGADGLKSRSVE